MNRTDRLLALVIELQARGWQRAEDLAATFEISKRTVYRDMQALAEAGVPVMSSPGRGYALVEGYFLPPIHFSVDEATLLLLGSDVIARNFDAELQTAIQSAARKIAGALPEERREQVREMQRRFVMVAVASNDDLPGMALLPALRRALLQGRRVRFRYHARRSADDVPLVREVDPLALVLVERTWYLGAYDHGRKAHRHFRLERMEDLDVLSVPVQHTARPEIGPPGQRDLVVRVLVAPAAMRWVRENRLYYLEHEQETADGFVLTLHVRHEDDVLQWLLGWGAQVRVLEPASLRERIAAEAKAIVEHYHVADSLLP